MSRRDDLVSTDDPPIGKAAASLAVALVLVVGAVAYLQWDSWFVNWDGGFYLYLGKSLHEGNGLSFPDGSPGYFRGPGYPGLFAVGWSLMDVTAKTAIWMSRLVLLGIGALVALLVARAGSVWPAVLAGLAAVIPSVALESGGWYFAPDGLSVALVLVAIAMAVMGGRMRSTMAVASGVFLGMAILTKETAVLYALVVPLVLWSREDRRVSIRAVGWYLIGMCGLVLLWITWADVQMGVAELRFVPVPSVLAQVLLGLGVVAGVFLVAGPSPTVRWLGSARASVVAMVAAPISLFGTVLTLRAVGEPLVVSLREGFGPASATLADALGWAWIPGLLIVGCAIIVRPRFRSKVSERLWLSGILLVAVGAGQAWYAVSAGLSIRNAVGGLIGLAILLGVSLNVIINNGWAAAKVAGALVAICFVGFAAFASAIIDRELGESFDTWDNPAVHELNQWLASTDATEVAVSPVYATYIWFLGGDLPTPELLAMHEAPSGRSRYELEDFCLRVWWAGDIPGCPTESPLRTAASNERVVGAAFPDAFGKGPDLVALTGNLTSGSAFDADVLVSRVEGFALGKVVFATSRRHLPYWAVVYEIDRSRWEDPGIPSVVDPGLDGLEDLTQGVVLYNPDEFAGLLNDVLAP